MEKIKKIGHRKQGKEKALMQQSVSCKERRHWAVAAAYEKRNGAQQALAQHRRLAASSGRTFFTLVASVFAKALTKFQPTQALSRWMLLTLALGLSACGGSDFGSGGSSGLIQFNTTFAQIEEGGSKEVTVRLAQAPTDVVTVKLGVSSGAVGFSIAEVDSIASAGEEVILIFTDADWSTPQSVYLFSAVDNNGTDDQIQLQVLEVTSFDTAYSSLDLSSLGLSVLQRDTVNKTLEILGAGAGREGSTVTLTLQFGGPVSTATFVNMNITGAGLTFEDGGTFLFLQIDQGVATKNFKVVASDDSIYTGDRSSSITAAVTGGDANFVDLTASLDFTTYDDETNNGGGNVTLSVTPSTAELNEGATGSLSLSLSGLTTWPSGGVTVVMDYSSSNLTINNGIRTISLTQAQPVGNVPYSVASSLSASETVTVTFTAFNTGSASNPSAEARLTLQPRNTGSDTVTVGFLSTAPLVINENGEAALQLFFNPKPTQTVFLNFSNVGPGSFLTVSDPQTGATFGNQVTIVPWAGDSPLYELKLTAGQVDDDWNGTIIMSESLDWLQINSENGALPVTIKNTDVAPADPVISISTDSSVAKSGGDAAALTISASGTWTGVIGVRLTATQINAEQGDFSLSGNLVYLTPSAPSSTVSLTALKNNYAAGASVTVAITIETGSAQVSPSGSSVTITLQSADAPPVLSLSFDASTDVAAKSVEETAQVVTVYIRASEALKETATATVSYSGNAVQNVDYTTSVTPTATIAAGQSSATISLTILSDSNIEDDETVVVSITSVTGGATKSSSDTVTLTIEAQAALPEISISATRNVAKNGGLPATLEIRTSSALSSSVTVSLIASSTSASLGSDFSLSLSSVTLTASQSSQEVTITALRPSYSGTPQVTVTITGLNPSSGVAEISSTNRAATISLQGTDAKPEISLSLDRSSQIATKNVNEGGQATVYLLASEALPQDATVTVQFAGTAAQSSDYTTDLSSTTLSMDAGVTRESFNLTFTSDGMAEPDETITITLVSVSGGATKASSSNVLTLTINEQKPSFSLTLDGSTNVNEGAQLNFTISTAGQTIGQDVGFSLSYSGTATNADFTSTRPTLATMRSGQNSVSFSMTVKNDNEDSDETMTVTIALTDTGKGTITQNSIKVTISAQPLPAQISISASDRSVDEGDSVAVTVKSDKSLSSNVVVALSYSVGSSSFYSGSLSSVTLSSSQSQSEFAINFLENNIEDARSLTITLSISSGTANPASPNSVTIEVASKAPSYTFTRSPNQNSINEGGSVEFTVASNMRLSQATTFSIGYSYTGGASGNDLSAKPTDVTIAQNTQTKTFSVRVANEGTVEDGEGFEVSIALEGTGRGSIPGTKSYTFGIVEQTAVSKSLTLSGLGGSYSEGDEFTVTVTASSNSGSVNYTLSHNGGTEIERKSGSTSDTLSNGGKANIVYRVKVDSKSPENEQTIRFTLSSTTQGVTFSGNNGTITILAESSTTIAITRPNGDTTQVAEGAASAKTLFKASYDGGALPSGVSLTLKMCTGTTCTPNQNLSGDIQSSIVTNTLSDGVTYGIKANNDTAWEAEEKYRFALAFVQGGSNYSFSGQNIVNVTIPANDAPGIQVSGGRSVTKGSTLTLTIATGNGASVPSVFSSGLDVSVSASSTHTTPTSTTLTLPSGSSSVTFEVTGASVGTQTYVFTPETAWGAAAASFEITVADDTSTSLGTLGDLGLQTLSAAEKPSAATVTGGRYLQFSLSDSGAGSITGKFLQSVANDNSPVVMTLPVYSGSGTSGSKGRVLFASHLVASNATFKAGAGSLSSSNQIALSYSSGNASLGTQYRSSNTYYLGTSVHFFDKNGVPAFIATAPRSSSPRTPKTVTAEFVPASSKWKFTETNYQASGYTASSLVSTSSNGYYTVYGQRKDSKLHLKVVDNNANDGQDCSKPYIDTGLALSLDSGRLSKYAYVDINNNGVVVAFIKSTSTQEAVTANACGSSWNSIDDAISLQSNSSTFIPWSNSYISFDLFEETNSMVMGVSGTFSKFSSDPRSCIFVLTTSQLRGFRNNYDSYKRYCQENQGRVHVAASHSGETIAAVMNFGYTRDNDKVVLLHKSGGSWSTPETWNIKHDPKNNTENERLTKRNTSAYSKYFGKTIKLSGDGKVLALSLHTGTQKEPIYFYTGSNPYAYDSSDTTNFGSGEYGLVNLYANLSTQASPSWVLVSTVAAIGSTTLYVNGSDRFGGGVPTGHFNAHGVALSETGDVMAVGANGYDKAASDGGALYIY